MKIYLVLILLIAMSQARYKLSNQKVLDRKTQNSANLQHNSESNISNKMRFQQDDDENEQQGENPDNYIDEKFPPAKELSGEDEFESKGFQKNLLKSLQKNQKKYIKVQIDERNTQSFIKKPNIDVFVQYLGYIRDSCEKTWEKLEDKFYAAPEK